MSSSTEPMGNGRNASSSSSKKDASRRNEPASLVEGLRNALADAYVLYFKTQVCHWNVTGPQFVALHQLFEQQYTDLAAAIDELAERIRALGEKPVASLREIVSRATLAEASDKLVDADEMVRQLAADHKMVATNLTLVCERAEARGDQGTLDLLGARIREHEKQAWMLQSSLG